MATAEQRLGWRARRRARLAADIAAGRAVPRKRVRVRCASCGRPIVSSVEYVVCPQCNERERINTLRAQCGLPLLTIPKERECLQCGCGFQSTGVENRICWRCRQHQQWNEEARTRRAR